tara:strand:+ start:20145 stop:20402 length:258 start_codon:yes stop_codon:yes gene_type:complete
VIGVRLAEHDFALAAVYCPLHFKIILAIAVTRIKAKCGVVVAVPYSCTSPSQYDFAHIAAVDVAAEGGGLSPCAAQEPDIPPKHA